MKRIITETFERGTICINGEDVGVTAGRVTFTHDREVYGPSPLRRAFGPWKLREAFLAAEKRRRAELFEGEPE